MEDTYTPEPWEQQPNESGQAYRAFCIYRDMGYQRSLMETARQYGCNKSQMTRWRKLQNWDERVRKYDADEDRRVREELEKGRLEMRIRHAGVAGRMVEKAYQFLECTDKELTWTDAIRAIMEGAKLERLSRGEATEKTETITEVTANVNSGLNFDNLSDAELEKLYELLGKSTDE